MLTMGLVGWRRRQNALLPAGGTPSADETHSCIRVTFAHIVKSAAAAPVAVWGLSRHTDTDAGRDRGDEMLCSLPRSLHRLHLHIVVL